MSGTKLSLIIPYKRRLDNIRVLFEGLANQTMDSSQFEVIVGAMEYSEEYIAACSEYVDRLDIISVVSSRDYESSRARNMAMRQASGEVIVHLDADTLLAPQVLENLYDRHFSYGQNVCIVGQVIGYGNNMDGDVTAVDVRPYSHHKRVLDELWNGVGTPPDPRFRATHVIPWAFAWTGLIALPAATVRAHNLFFDEDFHGWGAEDLEWGYRICANGIPIILREDVYGLHLPHIRDTRVNFSAERKNFRHFVRKWPRTDVELASAFGDEEGNRLFPGYRSELVAIMGGGYTFGVIGGLIGGSRVLVVGARLDGSHRVTDPGLLASFDNPAEVEILPLVGLGLPYDDESVDEVRALPPVERLSTKYRDAVRAEIQRVSKK
jgi:glycosyltransferase involved in cell wall biosynthesis